MFGPLHWEHSIWSCPIWIEVVGIVEAITLLGLSGWGLGCRVWVVWVVGLRMDGWCCVVCLLEGRGLMVRVGCCCKGV